MLRNETNETIEKLEGKLAVIEAKVAEIQKVSQAQQSLIESLSLALRQSEELANQNNNYLLNCIQDLYDLYAPSQPHYGNT